MIVFCVTLLLLHALVPMATVQNVTVSSEESSNVGLLILLLLAALATSLVVIAFLICNCIAAVARQKISCGQKSQQRDVDMRLYSAVVFSVMKTDRGVMKHADAAETERIYTAVKAFGLDQ